MKWPGSEYPGSCRNLLFYRDLSDGYGQKPPEFSARGQQPASQSRQRIELLLKFRVFRERTSGIDRTCQVKSEVIAEANCQQYCTPNGTGSNDCPEGDWANANRVCGADAEKKCGQRQKVRIPERVFQQRVKNFHTHAGRQPPACRRRCSQEIGDCATKPGPDRDANQGCPNQSGFRKELKYQVVWRCPDFTGSQLGWQAQF